MRGYLSLFRVTVLVAMFFFIGIPVGATEVALQKDGGVYTLPVKINRVITLDFILDSGASEVSIPADVVLTLLRAKTISENDFLSGKSYTLADGSVVRSERFLIRELDVGGERIANVPAMVAPVSGTLLLGQSFLQRIDSWMLDNRRNVLIMENHPQRRPHRVESSIKAEIISPQDGEIVTKSVSISGKLFGMTSRDQAFLIIQSAAPEFGKRIYPQAPITVRENGLWSTHGIYATPSYAYRTYIVVTDDSESAQLLASKRSRANGLTQLPRSTRIISSVITVHRK